MTQSLKDKDIVKLVLKGDKNSYGILVEKYKNLVYRLVLNMTGAYDGAEDLVQEAFMIGYENLERLNKPDLFASWLAGITRNVCRKHIRTNQKKTVSLVINQLTC